MCSSLLSDLHASADRRLGCTFKPTCTVLVTDTHTHTRVRADNASVFMVCGQPISGTKVPFAFHLKEISGFAQRQPNLDISNKAHLLPPSPLCSALCLCCTYICTFACSLRKKQFSSKSPSCEKRGLLRLATEGTELVGN